MGIARVNFGDIMQAVEDKLVADAVVADRNQITWAVNDKAPQLTGPQDILLRARSAIPIPEDGGGYDFRLKRFLDIVIRSQSVKDTGGNNKSWVKNHFVLADKILDSMLNEASYATFWPERNGEFLTTMPVQAVKDMPPERINDAAVWGDSVCTLELHYAPLLTPSGL